MSGSATISLEYAPAAIPLLLLLDGNSSHYWPDFIHEACESGVLSLVMQAAYRCCNILARREVKDKFAPTQKNETQLKLWKTVKRPGRQSCMYTGTVITICS